MILLFKQLSKPIWQVDTLDVGQGLATLIVKNGKGILYDTGPAWQGGNMAELEILPYLQREGITLEKLILSHDDNDHAGGASIILKAYRNVEFITPSRKNYGEITALFVLLDVIGIGKGYIFKYFHHTLLWSEQIIPILV